MSASEATAWRICAAPNAPLYYFNIESGEVSWALPEGVLACDVPAFTEDDESFVEEDRLIAAEDVATQSVPAATASDDTEWGPVAETSAESLVQSAQTPLFSTVAALSVKQDFPAGWSACHDVLPAHCPLVPAYFKLHANLSRAYHVGDVACGRWERRHTPSMGVEDGEAYYVHTVTQEQSWSRPEGFEDAGELGDVTDLCEAAEGGSSLSELLSRIHFSAEDAASWGAVCDQLAAAMAFLGRSSGASSSDASLLLHESESFDGIDLTSEYGSLLKLQALLHASSASASGLEVWASATAEGSYWLLRTLGRLLTPVSPPALSLVAVQLLTELSRCHRSTLRQLVDGRVSDFGGITAVLVNGVRTSVYGRQVAALLSRQVQCGGGGGSVPHQHSPIDLPALIDWLTLGTRVFLYTAGAVWRQRKRAAAASSSSICTTSSSTTLPPPILIAEDCIEWQGVAAAILLILGDACTMNSSPVGRGGNAVGVVAGVGLTRAIEEAMRFVAALHRVFEVAVLEADMEFEYSAVSRRASFVDADDEDVRAASVRGGGGKPRSATMYAVDTQPSTFAVISPVSEAFQVLIPSTEAADSEENGEGEGGGGGGGHRVSGMSSLAAGISAQWVNILAVTAERTLTRDTTPSSSRSASSSSSSSTSRGRGTPFGSGDEYSDGLGADDASVVEEAGEGHVVPAFTHRLQRCMLVSVLSLATSIVEYPPTSRLLYSNDLKVLIDVMLRELQDLPVLDHLRICWLKLMKAVLLQSQWFDAKGGCGRYRDEDISSTLGALFDVSTALSAGLPVDVRAMAEEVLIACRDVLEA